MTVTEANLRRAARVMDGKHPVHDWPVDDGTARAVPYLLRALLEEQRRTGDALELIAEHLEAKPTPRRRWYQRKEG
jgi:hypothetical protein